MENKRRIFRWLFLALLLFGSCDKEEDRIIPFVTVSFTIDLNIWNDLMVSGNSVFFPGPGYGGVIVYCEFPGSYYAFDATCTNEISRTCIIKNEGLLGTCPCCQSQFILLGGAFPSQGPAKYPLQQYHVSVSGKRLHVYN